MLVVIFCHRMLIITVVLPEQIIIIIIIVVVIKPKVARFFVIRLGERIGQYYRALYTPVLKLRKR